MADELKKAELEILVSTMNRTSLDFLEPMFPFAHFSTFNLLVINQSDGNAKLLSDFSKVRVINSAEKGLSKSRNLALRNTIGKIALIADDDVVFLPDFEKKVTEAHIENDDFGIICFQTLTTRNELYSNYKKKQFQMSNRHFTPVLSIEISLKSEEIVEKKIQFNEHFGLGSQFEDAESLFFLRRAHHNASKVLFVPETVVIHHETSSSDDIASDRLLYAKMAGFYKQYKSFAYVLLAKFLFFLLRKRIIGFSVLPSKLKVGLKGISDYRYLIKNKQERFDD